MLFQLVTHTFLEDLGMVLCVAAVTTVVFDAIKQPVVVGYLIAGLIVGPHVPVPLLADPQRVQVLSELGVILLMFALGLEFSIRKLIRLGPSAGFVTALQVGLMIWIGYVLGHALGWTELESIFIGVALSISSTTIVAKAFGEQGNLSQQLRDLVFGVLLAEDLTAVMLLAVLTALASGTGLSARMMLVTVGKLGLFLIALVGGGLLIVPRTVRLVVRLQRPETTLIASIGICFGLSILAEHAGYSVALGAFLAGSMVAESGEAQSIEHLVRPLRDIFGAVFFISVGMTLDPAQLAPHWIALVVLVLAVIFGKFIGVTMASLLSGVGIHTGVQAGMSLTQIGEFSFIIAGLGVSTHATRDFLYTLAVAVSAITTFTTPFMIRASDPVARLIAGHVPSRLGATQGMYDSLMERIRRVAVPFGAVMWPMVMLGGGAVAIGAILIANDVDYLGLTQHVLALSGLDLVESEIVVDLFTLLLCAPFAATMFFGARSLARSLVLMTLSEGHSREVTSGALTGPALALISMLSTTLLLVVVVPLLALVQPFLDPMEGIGVVILGVILMGIVIVRSVQRMYGQMGVLKRILAESLTAESATTPNQEEVPGFGMITPVRLEAGASAIGKTLAAIGLRAATGAAAIAISRDQEVLAADSGEVLKEGDVVGLTGTSQSVEAARRLLSERMPIPVISTSAS
jgi:CPA2 family monovalent cation:H+ antiporter-2